MIFILLYKTGMWIDFVCVFAQGLADNVVVSAGFPLPKELIAVVRPKSSCGWNVGDSTGTSKSGIICKVNQKTIVAEFMEMMLEVRFVEFLPPDMKVSRQQMETTKVIYTCKVKACTRCNIKGLYCFPTEKSILDSLFNRVGTYLFSFSLVKLSTLFAKSNQFV